MGSRRVRSSLATLVLLVAVGCSDDEPTSTAVLCPGVDTRAATVRVEGSDQLGDVGTLVVEIQVEADGDAFLFDERGRCYQSEPTDLAAGTYAATAVRGSGVGLIATLEDGSSLAFNVVQEG